MKSETICPVILSGGSGTRLWPLSRFRFPKQFLDLFGESSLFQKTCARIMGAEFTSPRILSNVEHRFMVEEQMAEIGCEAEAIILEPSSRNTAPAILTAALHAAAQQAGQLILILPSDHLITETEKFLSTLMQGIPAAKAGHIVTFGIRPTSPHTGYGYIETAAALDDAAFKVRRFHEKPSEEKASAYLNEQNYLWNAGIFLFQAETLINAMQQLNPAMLENCRNALAAAMEDLAFTRLEEKAYSTCENISFDYAVMEQADNIACVPMSCGWSDLGSWSAVAENTNPDADGNASMGDVLFEESRNCYAHSRDGAKLAVIGLENVLAVATRDAILVTSRERSEQVKEIVARIKANNCESAIDHKRVYRPWGWYESLNNGERFQVKCLMVKPGAQLSLQSHHHRAEHWVVVSGSVNVTLNGKQNLLSENQSTYIPIGAVHRLENPGKIPALLIEVQSGSYLGEDDIIRYQDDYGRIIPLKADDGTAS